MSLRFRYALAAALIIMFSSAMPSFAKTNYPSRAVTLVVPFSAGGTADLLGRLLGKRLSQRLEQPVVVENRPGAGSMVGTAHVAKANPDGYTLLLATSSSLVVAPVFTEASYDSVNDFTPISIVAASPFAVSVGSAVPARSIAELIALAKESPGKLNMASFGTGSSSHLAGELFKAMADIDMVHIPYKGSAPAITDLISGQVDVSFDMISAVLPHYEADNIRVLAVTGSERSDVLPDLPTVAETVTGYEATAWFGVVAPAGTPDAIVDLLNTELVNALDDPDIKELLSKQSLETVGSSPATFKRVIKEDLVKWAEVVKTAGITP